MTQNGALALSVQRLNALTIMTFFAFLQFIFSSALFSLLVWVLKDIFSTKNLDIGTKKTKTRLDFTSCLTSASIRLYC